MIAVHFENLLFLLFVAGAFLFQLLTRAASKTSKNADESQRRSTSTPQTPPPIPRGPAETDEQRIRKFLEALGQPTTSKPPPPVMPRPTYQRPVVLPHVGPFASPLPPLTTRPPDLPREIKLPGQLTPTHKAKTFTPKLAEPPTFEASEGALPGESPPTIEPPAEADVIATRPVLKRGQSKTDIAVLLTSTSGLRNAIILREVFGAAAQFAAGRSRWKRLSLGAKLVFFRLHPKRRRGGTGRRTGLKIQKSSILSDRF